MNEIATEKTMTVKEVAEVLKVNSETVKTYIREMFPDLMQNGKTTFLNEAQVTAIKLKLDSNPHLQRSLQVKTRLEKNLIIQQAMGFLQEENEQLKQENEELKPKAIEYDLFINNESHQKIGDVAITLGIKPNTLHKMLRDAKILKDNYAPYAGYEQYFKTVEKPTPAGFNVFTSYLKPNGISYIAKRFNLQRSA